MNGSIITYLIDQGYLFVNNMDWDLLMSALDHLYPDWRNTNSTCNFIEEDYQQVLDTINRLKRLVAFE